MLCNNIKFKLLLSILLLGLSSLLQASDHADPILVKGKSENITGLFFFPDGNDMILIFNVSPALISSSPYSLSDIEYVINIDLHSKIDFGNTANNARYGGTVVDSTQISADVTMRFTLDNDAKINTQEITGLNDINQIETYSGVRDDPFIFPRFFKKNVIAIVMRIPLNTFPQQQTNFLLWGQTFVKGKQIDHVGRSNRTQLPRFDFLNTLLPSEQVSNIVKKKRTQHNISDFLRMYKETNSLFGLFQYVFELRRYDAEPDVMIYSSSRNAGFPNGRRLTDDVAAITCAFGDCILQDVSFIEGGFPRAVINDKPFLKHFPYLAEPWPSQTPVKGKSIFEWWGLYAIIACLLLLIGLFAWFFYRLGKRSAK